MAEDVARVSIDDQVDCAEREVKMRRRVYARWVEGGRMKQAQADREIRAMEAIVETLKTVQSANRLF